jgi:4-amino-4-deoxychorismate lyase
MPCLINGTVADSISVADRGLQYGDGLFETISCLDGRPRWLALHLQRLLSGCERLQIPFPAAAQLEQEVRKLAAGTARCLVKVIVTRGSATVRGYGPSGAESPTRIVSRYAWPAAPAEPADSAEPAETGDAARVCGIRVGLSTIRLGENPALAGLKHLNRLEQVLAQQALRNSGYDEVLMQSSSGAVICASSANVFLVDQTGLYTPDVALCGVAGVMRRLVLETAAAAGIGVRVRTVTLHDLSQAQEVFLTNVRLGLQPVGWLHGRQLRAAQMAWRLRELIGATLP